MKFTILSGIIWLLVLSNTGIAISQSIPSNFSCGPVCLLAEWSCYCEVTGNDVNFLVLIWTLRGLNMQQVADQALFPGISVDAGTTHTFSEGNIIATVTNVTQTTITSVANGTINQTTDGYTLECLDVGGNAVVGIIEISIPDEPSQPENLTATNDPSTGSVLLSWTPPINSSQCVVGYIINSTLPNSIVSISTSLNHTLFAVDGVLSSCTYTASVAANDTAGRIGNWNQVFFSFNKSSPLMSDYPSQIPQPSLSYLSNHTVNISWILPSNLVLECIDFIISTNASAPSSTTNSSVLITRPVEDPADSIYTVSIAAMDKAGRTGEQSETLCFSFEHPRILEVHQDNAHGSTITIRWTVELSQCLPSITNYFITVNNSISSSINITNTNETMYILNDVRVGDVYVIEIVPSSALGNGSATSITISKSCTSHTEIMATASRAGITPTISSPLQSSTNIPSPTGLCVNDPSCLVIGIIVAIAVMVVLIMVVVSSLIAYFYFRKRKRSHLIMDSKETVHSSDGLNSETESAEQPLPSSANVQAYQCPSDATKEYNQQKQTSEIPKSEYASPQDAHCTAKKEAPQIPMYQEIEQLNKPEHHGDGGFSAQEKRATTTLNRSEITDTEGYSDLPAHSKKSSAGKKDGSKVVYSDVELQALPRPPPPPAQSQVEYTSLQAVEYAVVQKKKETQP